MTSPTTWHAQPISQVLAALGVDPDHGLSAQQAQQRRAETGPNELAERPRPGWIHRLWEQFDNFLILMLVAAALISFALGEGVDAAAILAIVVLNAILGIAQTQKTEEALAALKEMAAPEARVLRDGRRFGLRARELVPGDIVFLEAGNYVPADVRLVDSVNLRVDESSLTGESVAVEKREWVTLPADTPLADRVNCAFLGTTVTYGRGVAVVTAIGMDTQIGMIAEMIQAYGEETTPLQRRLDQLGHWLGWGALYICALVFLVAVVRDTDLGLLAQSGLGDYLAQHSSHLVDLFLTAVTLAIAAVPEGLPAVVTICLAIGMGEMARRNALIRRLPVVETLGSATAICSDKTGTLTQNEMTAVRLVAANVRLDISADGVDPAGSFYLGNQRTDPQAHPEIVALLTGGLLCSDARLEPSENGSHVAGDPTEGALVVAAARAGLRRGEVEADIPRVAEIPFDAERKRMSTLHKLNGRGTAPVGDAPPRCYVVYVKGAPDVILPRCERTLEGQRSVPLTPARRRHVRNVNRDMGQEALRVLAVAFRLLDGPPGSLEPEAIECDLTLIGLVGMTDPARPEVRPAIDTARQAGIRSIMVTGDYPDTARAIAAQIGMLREGGQVLTGTDLDEMSDRVLAARVEHVDVFARVNPSHKVRIVEALRRGGHVVAMTGDGVNDAPALKRADIGVAMGITGTDVSKEVADMVLTDDNYASIVSAVEQGRIIYANIRKFVYFLLSCNLAEIMIIFLAVLAGEVSPLAPIQLLWLNLLTDGGPALALGLEKGDPDIMNQPPRPPSEPIVNRPMVRGIVVQTVAITAVVLAAFYLGLHQAGGGVDLARTMAFVALAGSELLRAYTARSERISLLQMGLWRNGVMQVAVGTSLVLLLAVVYVPALQPVFHTVPLGWRQWLPLLPLLLIPAVVAEVNKWLAAPQRSKGMDSVSPRRSRR